MPYIDGAYLHNLSPFAIQFTETFGIRWYGLSYLAGFVCTYLIILWMAKRNLTPIKADRVSDFITFGAIGVLAGGRVGYALFYSPDLITQFSSDFPYWGVLEVHKGGMASHGGILGVVIALCYFAHKQKFSKLHALDLAGLGGGFGFLFGRLANFINGELYGRMAPESYNWAVKFPQEMYRWSSNEISKLKSLFPAVESLGPLQLKGGKTLQPDLAEWSSWVDGFRGSYRGYINTYIEKLIEAVQNGNQQVMETIAPVLTSRYPSQLIQSFCEGFLVIVCVFIVWRKPQKPGVIGGVFALSYGFARIVGEHFRMPDAHLGFQALGLTRGQWLSILQIVVILIYLWFVSRRNVDKIGGWGKE